MHKITAGDGYEYLTRQVAALDSTEKGHTSLEGYYSAQGESPGTWVGSGLEGLGVEPGSQVTTEQMRSLFGAGKHPDAARLRQAALAAGLDVVDQERAALLGSPFRVYDTPPEFQVQVARRIEQLNKEQGRVMSARVPLEDRARVRDEVATEMFRAEHGRAPDGPRELAAAVARFSRQQTTAVAGYDLTFSPVKSVSALWAVADLPTARIIEDAHHGAVADALAFVERHALYTREGANGVRQVDTRGLVAAQFTHRDSRAGDPDLHTHVAVSNKVQSRVSGRWLAVDGRVLYRAAVTASETYNTALEQRLVQALGVRFVERPSTDRRKRSVREIAGVDPALNEHWSSRRAAIEQRRSQLAAKFQADHGRPPSAVESIQLRQQANLETRQAKHEPRSHAAQRAAWAREASALLGGPQQVRAMIERALHPSAGLDRVDAAWMDRAADTVVATVAQDRATWSTWHLRSEAQRRVRGTAVPTEAREHVVGMLVDEALARSVPLGTHDAVDAATPSALLRADGSPVYTVAGSRLFTSRAVLDAEARVVSAAGRDGGARVPVEAVRRTVADHAAAEEFPLNAAQVRMVTEMATSGRRVQLALAPAGSGKTTAMRALADAWTSCGGDVLGLAPTAVAASTLGESIGTHSDTMASLVEHIRLEGSRPGHQPPQWVRDVGPRTLVVVDEAGMGDTLSLDTVVGWVLDRGGSVRLVGDDQQLTAVGAGGVLRDIRATHGCLSLTELVRFTDHAEAAASLALREGMTESLGFYLDRGRVHVGDLATMTDEVFDAWRADLAAGRDAVMLAPTRALVAELNRRARAERLGGTHDTRTVALADDNDASTGDTVITRDNDRRLRTGRADWVKNGDRWTITKVGHDGSLRVRHTSHGRSVTLPAWYVSQHVELGWATTIHAAQGVTCTTTHTLMDGRETRQLMYTAATRGAVANHLYVQVVGDGDEHNVIRPEAVLPPTATDILEQVLARDGSARSATTELRDQDAPEPRLALAAARYTDSLLVAAEDTLEPGTAAHLDATADHVVPGVTAAPAWETLRGLLMLHAVAQGTAPLDVLTDAYQERALPDQVRDVAALMSWRVDQVSGGGPLPWLHQIPEALADDPRWSHWLGACDAQVRDLAGQVREATTTQPLPAWAREGHRPGPALAADVAVWRAARGVDDADQRPTGPPAKDAPGRQWQKELDTRLGEASGALEVWGPVIDEVIGAPPPQAEDRPDRTDQFVPVLARRLAAVARAGLPAATLLRAAAATGPLPDDHQAAALWWRMAVELPPTVTAQAVHDQALTTPWQPDLARTVGIEAAGDIQTSLWWPALVAVVDRAVAAGSTVQSCLLPPEQPGPGDLCEAMVWRVAFLSQAPPPEADHAPDEPDREEDPFADDPVPWYVASPTLEEAVALPPHPEPPEPPDPGPFDEDPERSTRITDLNGAAWKFWTSSTPGSWVPDHLAGRGLPTAEAAWAPAGWTTTYSALRQAGWTDQDLLDAGLVAPGRRGLYDRFRDRLVVPVRDTSGRIVGFTARANPTAPPDTPKYLNTPDTTAYRKHKTLLGLDPQAVARLAAGARPVLVEGAMDRAAVQTLGDDLVPVAPCGTATTTDQLDLLRRTSPGALERLVVAMDNDPAGRAATVRLWDQLTPTEAEHAMVARTPPGTDPADMVKHGQSDELRKIVNLPVTPLWITVAATALDAYDTTTAEGRVLGVRAVGQVVKDLSAPTVYSAAQYVAAHLGRPRYVHPDGRTWHDDEPRPDWATRQWCAGARLHGMDVTTIRDQLLDAWEGDRPTPKTPTRRPAQAPRTRRPAPAPTHNGPTR